jgi:transposase, IS30 family
MRTQYRQLTTDDRNRIQRGLNEGLSRREIARRLGRWPSVVSREISRNRVGASYDAVSAGQRTRSRCRRGQRKLGVGTALLGKIHVGLLRGWSPEQIAGRLKRVHPDEPTERVSHETLYSYIYAQPRGELRKTLIAALRQGHKKRLARSRGTDRRGRLRDMVSIHERPEEALGRQVPGHWEGDLIKGAGNAGAVGTLVERKSRYVLLAKMDGADAEVALEGFTRRMRMLPPGVQHPGVLRRSS